MMRKVTLVLLFSVSLLSMKAQKIALHNNLVCDAAGSVSLGTELALKPRTTLEIYGMVRPWKSSGDKVNKYWAAEAQCRFWTCQKYNGFYYGPYVLGGQFNVGNTTPFFGLPTCTKDNRYEGWLLGCGLGVGYEFVLSKHWNIGAEIGAGYTYIDYKKFNCGVCGNLKDKGNYHYFGISKVGVNLIFLF